MGLTTGERIELARVILWREINSWKDLDDAQVDRLLDVLEGAILVPYLLSLRTEVGLRPMDVGDDSLADAESPADSGL